MPIRNKVQPGERRILSDEYNAFLAMTQQAKLGIGSGGFSDFYQASRAYVKNTTAAKVNAFEVLALDSPVITRQENNPEFFGAPTFDGVMPDIDLHKGKFAILQEPAMPGDTVRAVVAGATWVWLNIVSADDTTAEIADGVTSYLQTGTDGSAKILWKEAGTGTDKAGLVSLNVGAPAPGIPFRNDSGETVPAYAVMRVTGSATVSGTEYVTVAKPNTDFKRKYLVNGSSSVAAGAYGSGTWLDEGGWVLVDDQTLTSGHGWGPANNSWKLFPERYGFLAVGNKKWVDSSLVARFVQEEVREIRIKTSSSVVQKGDTPTLDVYANGFTTSQTATVEFPFFALASSSFAVAEWYDNKWVAHAGHTPSALETENGFTLTGGYGVISPTLDSGYVRNSVGAPITVGRTIASKATSTLTVESGFSSQKFVVMWKATIGVDDVGPQTYGERTVTLRHNGTDVDVWEEKTQWVPSGGGTLQASGDQKFTASGWCILTMSSGDTLRIFVRTNETTLGSVAGDIMILPLFL